MPARPIVLDANILIRFVLGEKVPALLAAHAAMIDFLAPDSAFEPRNRSWTRPSGLQFGARARPGAGVPCASLGLDAAGLRPQD